MKKTEKAGRKERKEKKKSWEQTNTLKKYKKNEIQ